MGKSRDPKYVQEQLKKQRIAEEQRRLRSLSTAELEKETQELAAEPQEEESKVTSETTIAEETTTQEEPTEEEESNTIGSNLSAEVEAEIAKLGLPSAEVIDTTSGTTTDSNHDDVAALEPAVKKAGRPKKDASATPATPKTPARLLADHCRVCGKSLTNDKSVTRGIGPVCYAAMIRTFKWTDADARNHVSNDTDEEWTSLVEQVRELLSNTTAELTEIPEGYVTMSSWWREAEKHNLSGSAIKRAVGGDRAVGNVLDERFQCVYVQDGNRARKYLPPQAMTEEAFAAIANTMAKTGVLRGAAKTAKEKAAAKAEEPVAATA